MKLLVDLNDLLKEQIIDEKTAQMIKTYHQRKYKPKTFILLQILIFILLSFSLLTLIGANWDEFGVNTRFLIVFSLFIILLFAGLKQHLNNNEMAMPILFSANICYFLTVVVIYQIFNQNDLYFLLISSFGMNLLAIAAQKYKILFAQSIITSILWYIFTISYSLPIPLIANLVHIFIIATCLFTSIKHKSSILAVLWIVALFLYYYESGYTHPYNIVLFAILLNIFANLFGLYVDKFKNLFINLSYLVILSTAIFCPIIYILQDNTNGIIFPTLDYMTIFLTILGLYFAIIGNRTNMIFITILNYVIYFQYLNLEHLLFYCLFVTEVLFVIFLVLKESIINKNTQLIWITTLAFIGFICIIFLEIVDASYLLFSATFLASALIYYLMFKRLSNGIQN